MALSESFTRHYLETALRTEQRGRLERPDGCAKGESRCGDTVEISLNVMGDRIQTARVEAFGCIHTQACANAIVLLIEGKPLIYAWRLSPTAVARYLKALPDDEFHCAELVIAVLRKALSDCHIHLCNPWKKAYRRS